MLHRNMCHERYHIADFGFQPYVFGACTHVSSGSCSRTSGSAANLACLVNRSARSEYHQELTRSVHAYDSRTDGLAYGVSAEGLLACAKGLLACAKGLLACAKGLLACAKGLKHPYFNGGIGDKGGGSPPPLVPISKTQISQRIFRVT